MPNTHVYSCDYVHPVRHYKNGLYLPMDLGKSLKYSSEEFPDFNLGNNSCLAKVGLSYSSFEYGDLKLSADKLRPGEKIMATVQFKNTGKYAATEIVQLYIRDVAASVTRPIKELKAFQRIALKPGESRNIDFELNARDVAFWNTHMQFGAEAGRFDVMIGSSSADDDLKNASFILIESQQLKY